MLRLERRVGATGKDLEERMRSDQGEDGCWWALLLAVTLVQPGARPSGADHRGRYGIQRERCDRRRAALW